MTEEKKKGWVDLNKRDRDYNVYLVLKWDRKQASLPEHKAELFQELDKKFGKKNVKYQTK